MEQINIRRIKVMAAFFAAMMVMLLCRLIYIQAICHEKFEEAAISQYEIAVEGLDTRGRILDRNGMPLTGGVKEYYYIIKKVYSPQKLTALAGRAEAKQVAEKSSDYWVYRTEIFDEEINRELKEKYGAYVFQTTSRYADDQPACHLIGYLNENEKVGVSGIELLKQEELAAGESTLAVWADAAGRIIKGLGPMVDRGSTGLKAMGESSVVTTIDRRLQYVCEKALAEKTQRGAAVVMDAETGEILAWASAPVFNPNFVSEYLTEDNDCLINKVCQGAYAPGSVFKIVTAAAALESGQLKPQQQFECTGEVTVGGVTLGCLSAPEGGHGVLDMKQAMARSCNCYFAQLGEAVGPEIIIKQARKMGLGEMALKGFPQESAGNLPEESALGAWDISNISIGQGTILTTPIQICRMTAVIANGGRMTEPKIFSQAETKTQKEKEENRVVSPRAAASIEDMLSSVMTEGTGSDHWSRPVWGKTGTAEAGVDGQIKNCWFTGYCRKDDKTYVITVFTEDGASGASTALPVFKEIVEYLR